MKNIKRVMVYIITVCCLLIFSACGKKTSTTITLVPNIGDVIGAKVTLKNNRNKSHVYDQTAMGTTVDFKSVVPGSYTLTVEHHGVLTFTQGDVTVHNTVAGFTANLIIKGPAGGYVFYDKGSVTGGWRYLEAAPSDEGSAEWGAYGIYVPGTSTDLGTGKANTQAIISQLQQLGENGRAAQLCVNKTLNGFSDWFLPSKDELNEMYKTRNTIGGFSNAYYWSSSQYDESDYGVWYQDFKDDGKNATSKDVTQRVRAVRAF